MLKQRLLMAASYHVTPPTTAKLYSFGDNTKGQTAQNTASGTTNSPTAADDSHTNWSQLVSCGYDIGGNNYAGCLGLQSDGTLWSWGSNDLGTGTAQGQIAQGNTTVNLLVPTQVTGASNWSQIAQGPRGGIGVRSDGTMWSWGMDTYGQLGQGGTGANYYTPTQIGVLTTWSKAFTGGTPSLIVSFFLATNGVLWTAGRNLYYLTGLGTNSGNTTTLTPVNASTWLMVTVGPHGCLGIQTNGTLWSWGTEQNYELGQGTVGGVFTTPTQVGTDTNWAFVSTGSNASLAASPTFAIKTNGTLWSCGSNLSYQTGQGTSSGSTGTLTQVGSATTWSEVYYVCDQVYGTNTGGVGLRTDGTIWSWGANYLAMTGQGTTSGSIASPTQIGIATSWTNIIAGSTASVMLIQN